MESLKVGPFLRECHIFVDDSNLLYSSHKNELNSTIIIIENELVKVSQWVDENSLSLNNDKTKLLVIAPPNISRGIGTVDIKINNILIEQCNHLKCLGLTIDNTLNWNLHINNIAKACNSRISSLYKIQNYVPLKYKMMLAHALVISLFNYMSTVWSCTTKNNLDIIEKVIRILARFV